MTNEIKALPYDLREAPFAVQRAYVEGYNAAMLNGSVAPDVAGRNSIKELLPKIIRLRSFKKGAEVLA